MMTVLQYDYEHLPPDCIRILKLRPGLPKDKLEGELRIVSLFKSDGSASQAFEALSYVWGDPTKADDLDVSGRIIAITASLAGALRRVRHRDKERLIWADGICINQNDIMEKESQVAMMGNIFSGATRVLADLGEASQCSDQAFDLIERYWRTAICSGAKATTYGRELSPSELAILLDLPADAVDMSRADDEIPDEEQPAWEPVRSLMQRPWFSRVWIVQEFVLARDVVFYCGLRTLNWRSFLALTVSYNRGLAVDSKTILWDMVRSHNDTPVCRPDMLAHVRRLTQHRMCRLLKESPAGKGFLSGLPKRQLRWWRMSWTDLLHSFRDYSSTIARDRYYAMLGMASDRNDEKTSRTMTPDYDTEDREWTLAAEKLILQLPSGADLFLHGGLKMQGDGNMSSWMQSYGDADSVGAVDHSEWDMTSAAAGDSLFYLRSQQGDDDMIVLRGHKVDQISNICERPFAVYVDDEIDQSSLTEVRESFLLDYLRSAVDFFSSHVLPEDDRHALEAPYDDQILQGIVTTIFIRPDASTMMFATLDTDHLLTTLLIGVYFLLRNACHPPKSLDRWTSTVGSKLEAALERTGTTEASDGASEQSRVDAMTTAMDCASFACYLKMAMAFTSTGSFCSVPGRAQLDDEIWIVSGCRLPMALRRSVDRPGAYRLVGTCFSQGIMDGEALKKEGFAWGDVSIH